MIEKIEALKKLLDKENSFDQVPVKILPNGAIVSIDDETPLPKKMKPLTFKEDLGGEYGMAA